MRARNIRVVVKLVVGVTWNIPVLTLLGLTRLHRSFPNKLPEYGRLPEAALFVTFRPLQLDILFLRPISSHLWVGRSTGKRKYLSDKGQNLTDKEANRLHILPRPQACRNIFVRLNMGTKLIHVVIMCYVDETRDDHVSCIFISCRKTFGRSARVAEYQVEVALEKVIIVLCYPTVQVTPPYLIHRYYRLRNRDWKRIVQLSW